MISDEERILFEVLMAFGYGSQSRFVTKETCDAIWKRYLGYLFGANNQQRIPHWEEPNHRPLALAKVEAIGQRAAELAGAGNPILPEHFAQAADEVEGGNGTAWCIDP